MKQPAGKLLFVVNEAYFFLSHRLPIAREAMSRGYEVHVAAPDDHVWAPEGFGVEALAAEGFIYHRVPLSRRGVNPLQEVRTLLSLVRLYRRLRPTIVHHLTIKPVLYGGLAARLTGVPGMVSAVTGLGQMFIGRDIRTRLLRRLAVALYRSATRHPNARVIVQNPDDGKLLSGIGAVDAAQIVLIRGSGVSMSAFTPSPDRAGTPLVVLPARLIWEKGVGVFAEAARRLKAQGVMARFALVGSTAESNPRAVPAARLRAWEQEEAVEWWGRREDMAAVFAASHIVCLPSSYGEGVPKVLIEAAASARPIVTTDIPGCREVVRNGENGILVPPGDVGALADALRRLIEDGEMRRRFGRRGREIVEAEFSEDEVVRRTMLVYDLVTPMAREKSATMP